MKTLSIHVPARCLLIESALPVPKPMWRLGRVRIEVPSEHDQPVREVNECAARDEDHREV